MTSNRLPQDQPAFGPSEIAVLVVAFEDALNQLHMTNRADDITNIVAKRIIDLAREGERDPARLTEGTLKSLLL